MYNILKVSTESTYGGIYFSVMFLILREGRVALQCSYLFTLLCGNKNVLEVI